MIRAVVKSLDLKKIVIELPAPKMSKFIFKSTTHPLECIAEMQMLGKVETSIAPQKSLLLPEWIKKGNNITITNNNKKIIYNLDCSEIDSLLKSKNSELFDINRKIIIMDNFINTIKHNQHQITNRWKVGGVAYLFLQFGSLLFLTYHEAGLTWDIVEPITCLLGLASSVLSVLFYKLFFHDYTYEQLFEQLSAKAANNVFNSWHVKKEFLNLSNLLDIDPTITYPEFLEYHSECKVKRQKLVSDLKPWTSAKMLKEWKSINSHWMPRIVDSVNTF